VIIERGEKGRTEDDPVYGKAIKANIEALRMIKTTGMLGKHQSEESKKKQSETRKKRYASGELKPARGVGRGKYSYFFHDGKFILLRSTYEFIYALYLEHKDVDFEYETLRVTYNGRTRVSDFLIGDKVVEIKGFYDYDYSESKEAFESNGYKYEILFWKDLEPIYLYLKDYYDIDTILSDITRLHDEKNYFRFNIKDWR